MKKPLSLFILFFLFIAANAQSWQWGIRGGGFSDGLNIIPEESVIDMATDPNGNVYILAVIESSGNPTLETTSLTPYGNRDVLVASYNCSGNLRWKKVIGGVDNDRPVAIRADSSGHIYVTGINITVNTHNVHFANDSAQSQNNYKSLYLVQYDTSGVFKWLRQPAPDTVAAGVNPAKFYSYDLDVTPAGDVFMLSYLNPGLLSGGGNNVITETGNYILCYNVNGGLTNIIKLDMEGKPAFRSIRLARTTSGKFEVSGSLDVSGSGTNYFYMGGQQITHGMFIGCFDPQGQFLWRAENTFSYGGFWYRPVVDLSGNIYLAGQSGSGDSFNGTAITNTLGSSSVPLIVKLDSNGNNIWLKNASTNAATQCNGLILSNNKVYLISDYPGKVVWDSYQYNSPPNTDYDVSLTTFDAQTGAVLKLDSLKSDFGVYDRSASITADKRGNIFVGGFFGSQLNVNGTTLYNSGGSSDFFLAKYGSANCSVLPVSLLSFTAALQQNIVQCNWQTASQQNTSHFVLERSTDGYSFHTVANINAAGNSNALLSYNYNDNAISSLSAAKLYYRLKMADKNGSFTYSNIVVINLASTLFLTLSPNPLATTATINYSFPQEPSNSQSLDVYDLAGKKVASYTLQQKGTLHIDMSSKTAGIYLLAFKQNGILLKTLKMEVRR